MRPTASDKIAESGRTRPKFFEEFFAEARLRNRAKRRLQSLAGWHIKMPHQRGLHALKNAAHGPLRKPHPLGDFGVAALLQLKIDE
jgi:hypothetical protein